MTITEKILASHSGRDRVRPGELVWAKVDLCMSSDVTTGLSVQSFKQMGAPSLFDKTKLVLVNDHFVPAKDIKSAEMSKVQREFAREHEIPHYFEVGRSGICHNLLPQEGFVLPGSLILGADSHTCTYGGWGCFATGVGSTDLAAAWALGATWLRVPETIRVIIQGKRGPFVGGKDLVLRVIKDLGMDGATYKAIEYVGEAISELPQYGRSTICNMGIEAGAKNAVIAADEKTDEWLRGRTNELYEKVQSDPDAEFSMTLEYNASELSPQVAAPFLPSNVTPVEKLAADNITLDQVFIGSCTNGLIEDMREAAAVMRGHRVHPNVRMIVIPGTQRVFQECVKEGLAEIFVEAGAVFSTPTCGPCLGGSMGVLGVKERCLSTTNRNFYGRMGHPSAEVYLANPAVAAASAIAGKVADPREL
jgi:3-isopropylmalate/(R)-2-methylmalate dehydratase large subunit